MKFVFFSKFFSILLIGMIVNACSKSSKEIVGLYVSPLEYADYSCDQIKSEMIRVSTKVRTLTIELNKNKENSIIKRAVTILLFPLVFVDIDTKELEAELARHKGEHEALDKVATQKNCIVR